MNYDRFQLLPAEIEEAKRCRAMLPYRDWHIVKPLVGGAIIVDSKRRATAQAKKHAPAAIYRVVGI
jgi:hypothetical protein